MLNPFEFSEPTNVGITYTVKEVPFFVLTSVKTVQFAT